MGKVYSSNSSSIASHIANSSLNLNDDELTALIQSKNLYGRSDIEWYDKINRFGCIDPYDSLNNTREYIFITKPDLHIFNNYNPAYLNPELEGIPFFDDALVRYPSVLKQLQKSHSGNTNPFVTIITNSVKSSLDLPDVTAEIGETSSTYQGFNIQYREDSYESDMQHSFSLELLDTKYLELYMYFKIYDEYEKIKQDGDITPPNENYRLKRKLHDQSCAYKIIVDNDGETILFFAKLWGVFPKNVPRTVFGNLSDNSQLMLSIDFNASSVRDSDPLILKDFNRLVYPFKTCYSKDIPLYNSDYNTIDGRWCHIPYIDTSEVDDGEVPSISPVPRYKLKWR